MMSIGSATAAVACALLVALSGCGDDDATTPSGAAASPPPATGAAGSSPAGNLSLSAGGLTVAEVLADSTGGLLGVRAFVVVDANGGARLCDALAESFPPQCGGARIVVTGLPPELVEGLSADSGVRWSETPIQLLGAVRDGVFVNDQVALAAG